MPFREIDLLILAAMFLQLGGLAIAVCVDSYISPKHKTHLLAITVLNAVLVIQNSMEYVLIVGTPNVPLRTAVAIAGYCIRPMILVLFLHIISPKRDYLAAWILAGINAGINLTASFSHLCFWINETNHFQRGPLSRSCLVVSIILLIWLLYTTIRLHASGGKQEIIIPLCIFLLICLSIFADGNLEDDQPVSCLTIVSVSSCIFYYIWLHLQFVREHEEDMKAEQRIKIMMTQIQPHFLYNTLSTIQSLCHIDPEKAYRVTGEFGAYLRRNIDSLESRELIPLEKELEHARTYANIEMVRFPNTRVEFDIQDKDYSLPPLTIQPLVENAIRHGVRIRGEGVVRVITRLAGNNHEILIRDNGVGFDPARMNQDSGTHIGIQNVRERIEKMCRGTLEIDSRPGEGTTVRIAVPVLSSSRPVSENQGGAEH